MGLRCLIGHDYGEPQTERDRRQRGSEVVVTVREFRECGRCGHRRILSENKEVTTDPTAGQSGEAPTEPAAGTTPGTSAERSAEAAWSPPDDRAGLASGSGTAGGPTDEPVTAEEDDGVILEDEPEQRPRAHGEWPEAEVGDEGDELEDDHGPWPDEDEAPAPEADADHTGAEVLDEAAETTDPPDAGSEPGPDTPAPDEADPMTRSPEDEAGSAAGAEASGERAGSGAPPAESSSTPTPSPDPSEVELVCPDCGETWESVNASLRPGDICPECRRGYLDERVIQ